MLVCSNVIYSEPMRASRKAERELRNTIHSFFLDYEKIKDQRPRLWKDHPEVKTAFYIVHWVPDPRRREGKLTGVSAQCIINSFSPLPNEATTV